MVGARKLKEHSSLETHMLYQYEVYKTIILLIKINLIRDICYDAIFLLFISPV